jgi:predicted Zn-dependent protease
MNRIVTKTLAEIYIQQGDLEEAYRILKALSEKDPSDVEIQKKLAELSNTLKNSSPLPPPSNHTAEEKIQRLERWLTHIQERKHR